MKAGSFERSLSKEQRAELVVMRKISQRLLAWFRRQKDVNDTPHAVAIMGMTLVSYFALHAASPEGECEEFIKVLRSSLNKVMDAMAEAEHDAR